MLYIHTEVHMSYLHFLMPRAYLMLIYLQIEGAQIIILPRAPKFLKPVLVGTIQISLEPALLSKTA